MGSSSSKHAHGSSSKRQSTNPIEMPIPNPAPAPFPLSMPIPAPVPVPVPAPVAEDTLLALARFDTVLLVDDSSSMRGPRWTQAGNALATLANIASRYDTDGIDIEFLNSTTRGSGMKDAAAVEALFASVSPKWGTPLGTRVEAILNAYLRRFEKDPQHTKPLNLIVITDGAPTDGTATENAIVLTARALDAHNARTTQLGIQFVQIGNDANARAYLEMLDNGMVRHGVRDMVDTTLSGDGDGLDLDLVKILIGAINRRVDNKGSGVLTGKA